MKKIISILISIIVIVLFLLFIIVDKNDFSENENRYLEKFPKFTINSLFNGNYTNRIDNYVSDHFPFRNSFLSLKTYLLKITNNQISNIYIGKDGYLFEEFNKPKNNKSIVRIINSFINNNKARSIQVMLVPTSTYIYSEKLPKRTINYNQAETIKYYKEHIKTDFIDVISTLVNNKDKYIYYKTDHHWTMIGAYYAYTYYCNYNNIKHLNYSIESVNDDFYGTSYSKLLDNTLQKDSIYKVNTPSNINVNYDGNIDNRIYFNEWLDKKDKYSYYLNGNHPIITINNYETMSDKKLLIIKDSYANNFIPFLIAHYKDITIIDPRYYKKSINDYINTHNYTYILFLYNISTLDDDLGIRTINRK